jgi:hypothetical protein
LQPPARPFLVGCRHPELHRRIRQYRRADVASGHDDGIVVRELALAAHENCAHAGMS